MHDHESAIRTSHTLVLAAVGGDREAWAAIHARYGPVVDGRIARFRLQPADAADVRQSVWLKLLEHATRMHTPEHLGGWLATVATRECLGLLRSRGRGPVLDDEVLARQADDLPPSDAGLIAAEERAAVRSALETLSERRRRVVDALFSADPRPYAELSAELGMPVGSIGPTRARALDDLRRELVAR